MAEFILKDMVQKAGLEKDFSIASAATSAEELGNPVYPPARRKLAQHGVPCGERGARRLTREDYSAYDHLIGMDLENLENMQRLFSGDPDGKVHLLLDFTGKRRAVADPWYTRDFEAAYQDILSGCQALLDTLRRGLQ